MMIEYKPKGVCSRLMQIEVDGGIVKNLHITGGCDGNLKGICVLVKGRPVEEIISLLGGITCGMKRTSCPDQLAIALNQMSGVAAK